MNYYLIFECLNIGIFMNKASEKRQYNSTSEANNEVF